MIRFRCPDEACAMKLAVGDEAAGRPGKCPACGAPFVVPQAAPVPAAAEERNPGPSTEAKPVGLDDEFAGTGERDPDDAVGPPARATSYGPIGLGWQLLRAELGTWVLTTFLLSLVTFGLAFVTQAVAVASGTTSSRKDGPTGPSCSTHRAGLCPSDSVETANPGPTRVIFWSRFRN